MADRQNPKINQSVDLTLRMLEKLAQDGGEMGVTELAKALGTTKARVFRHLQTLRLLGYVSQNQKSHKDRVGMRLYLLSKMVGDNFKLNSAVRPALEALRDTTMQTAVFATVLDGKMTIVDFALGTTTIQFALRPGTTFNLNSAALGHISLAFGPPEYWQYVKADVFEKETEKTNTDPDKLPARVAKAKARGWTIVPEEANAGVNAIAAPVFHHDGAYAGAIAIVGSVQHVPAEPPRELVRHVLKAARDASGNLGWWPDPSDRR